MKIEDKLTLKDILIKLLSHNHPDQEELLSVAFFKLKDLEQTLKNDTEILDWIDSFHGSLKVRRRIGREPFYHLCKTSCEEQTADNIRDLILKAKGEG